MATTLPVLRFGEFTLDRNSYALHRAGQPIRLQPKTFDVLAYLVDNPGRIVREDLVAAVWPGVIVTDHSLTRCIKDLRRALGDEAANPRFIETVARRGYRFLAFPQPLVPAQPEAMPGGEAPVVQASSGERRGWLRRGQLGVLVLYAALALFGARDTAVRNGTDNLDALQAFELGNELIQRRPVDWPKQALSAFDRALSHDALFAGAHAGRGTVLALRMGDSLRPAEVAAQARVSIAQALALDPDSAMAHAAHGFVRLEEGDAKGAERDLRRALARDPRYGNAWNWLNKALLRQGRRDEALAALESGVRADPLHPSLLANIGIHYQSRARYAEARSSYARLQQLPQLTFQAQGALVDVSLAQGRLAEALDHSLEWEARAQGPLLRHTKLRTALILARLGYPTEARARLRAVVDDGMTWQGLYVVDRLLQTLGESGELQALASRLAPAGERPVPLQAMLSRTELLEGDVSGAIGKLADALANSPQPAFGGWGESADFLDQRLALAYGLQRLGRTDEARAALDGLLADHGRAASQGLGHTPDELGLLALGQSLAGERERALRTLDAAIDAGWNDVFRADGDPRWHGLRAEPRFQEAMARARQALARERGSARLALAAHGTAK